MTKPELTLEQRPCSLPAQKGHVKVVRLLLAARADW